MVSQLSASPMKNAVILSKIIFVPAKSAYNICAKFQIDCLKTLGGIDNTNLLPNIEA